MKYFLSALLFLVLGLAIACSTEGYRVNDQNWSLADIKKAIMLTIGDPRHVSENQRSFYSQYFSRRKESKFDPEKSKERLYAKVTILGDERPYDIDLEVIVEQRNGGVYENIGTDPKEASKLGTDLENKLNQGRKDRNVIDGLRAF